MNDYSNNYDDLPIGVITSSVDTINILNIDNTWASTTGLLPGAVQQKMTPLQVAHDILGADDIISINSIRNTHVTGDLTVNDRDVMAEIDELREALMLPSRNIKLEENYPELKEAYDTYMEVYRGIRVADRLEKTGEQYGDES